MASRFNLLPGAAELSGTTNNAYRTSEFNRIVGRYDATTKEHQLWSVGYLPSGWTPPVSAVVVGYMCSANTGTFNSQLRMECKSLDGTVSVSSDSFDAVNSATVNVPGTNQLIFSSIYVLTNHSNSAAGKLARFLHQRGVEIDNATDDYALLVIHILDNT